MSSKLTEAEKVHRTQSIGRLERSRKQLVALATALREHDCRSEILEAAKWIAIAEAKMARGTGLVFENGTWKRPK